MSANDFFASLTKQAREKDRTVSKSSTVNSKAATISAPATDANTFFSSLHRQAQFIDRNGFTPKTLANVGNVSKEEASVAKAPLLSGYEERSFGDTVRDIGTVVGGAILQGADAAATGISSTLDFLIGRPLQALGWENNPASWLNDKLQSEREANAEYFNQQLEGNEAAQTALDLGTAVSRAAWELPLIIMTGGASKAAQAGTKGLQATAALESTLQSSGIGQTVTNAVNLLQRQLRNPQTWQSFASTTGQAYEDAKAQGASEASATAYAVINGLLGSLVEVGGGGIQELPDVLRQPSRLRNWIDTMLDEGKEEVVQGVIDRLTENVTGVANNPIVGSGDDNAVFNLGTALEEFGGGALVGGILGGGQIGVDAALNRIRNNTSQNAADAPTADAVTQTGVDTSTGVNPVEAGIDASVRLFNEGGGVIDAQTPGDSRYMKESAPDNIKTGVTAQDGVTGGSGTLSNDSRPDFGQNVNGQETTSDGRATPSSAFDTVSPPADASITVPGENVNALADSMTDEQLALEQQRNNADIASINDVLNAAQGGQQFPQGIIDQLTGQLPGLMQEQQRLASVEQAKRVQRGEVSRSFGQPENHIDNRNPDSVKGNRVAAFSFDHPQLHGYFVQAARDLQGMADYAAEAERGRSNRGNRIDRERNRSAVEHAYSRELRNAMESGDLSKPQVLDACQRIIDNHGQENVLAAKRVELILDDMLTNGYTTADGVDVAPNMEYIAAKEQIAGARGAERAIERYDDDLAIGAFGMPYTDAELAEQEVERQRIRDQYAAMRGQGVNATEIPNGSTAVNPEGSTGAAPAGFDTYSAALERYGEMPERGTGAREMSVPNRMTDDSVVPQTVQTFANAGATPETTYTDITRILEEGGFNRAVITDRASLGRAEQTITDKGFQQALIDWTSAVRSGRVSKDTTTLGLVLYNNAINSGDTQTGIQILTDIVDNARTAAQATQAMSILNKLTPEGRLYGVQRSIANLQEKIRERNTGGISDEQINRAQANIEQQRDDALNLIAQMHEIFSGGSKRQNSPDWITQIANELARNISARANTNTPRERTFAETVLSDLVKFAEEHALPRRQNIRRQRTAAERISDYFANRNEYARAWAQAQEIVRKRHGDAYTGNLTFDDWLSASIGYTGDGTDGVMLRAVADAALRGDPAVRNRVKQHLAVRSEYGDADAVVDEIYNRLLEDVTVTEYSDRIVLRNAVQRYIAELVQDTDTNRPVNSALRSAMHDAGVRMREIIRQGASTKEQVANNLARMLVNEFGFSENGAADFSSNVVNRFNEQVAEASKRALSSMFRPRQARQRRTFEQRLTEMANLGAFSSDEFSVQASQRLFGDLGDDIRLNDELVQNYLSAADEDARFAALNEIYKDIANQIPQNWYDKLNAWRYFAMLANPRTHVRNVLGNSAMAGLTSVRNRISSGLQRRFVSDRSQRTRETISRRNSAEDAARYQVGLQEYKRINDMLGDAGKYTNELNRIRRHMRAPFNGVLGKAVDFASNTLEAEDIFFSQKAYASNLAQFLRARGITAEDYVSGNAGQEVIAEAQAYAIREAQRLTFRDFNTFSNFVQRIANLGGDSAAGRVWQTIVGANIPFTRTPANIVVRGVEYSPIGLARGLYNLGVNVKRGNMTAGEAIDQISSGLVGTALVGLGALLASQGVITGGGSDDEEQAAFDELRGFQPYALQIGGNSYTLDWLAPAALPFFTGAEIWNQLAGSGSEDEETNALEAVLQGIGHMTDPMLEMSMLSGISDLLDSVAYYQGSNSIWPVLSSSVTNYISQFFPSVFGALERTIEDTRQSSYTDPTSIIPDDLQYPISQAMNRLPGEYNQVDYIDAWGRTESTGSLAGRAASNFVSPGYYSRLSESEVEGELQRVYDATGGEYNVFPDRATMGNTTINGERLTPEQYTEYATMLGQTRLAEVSALMETDAYKAMSDAEKARAIQEVYDYALQTAKHAIDPSYEVDSRYEKAAEYGDIAEYLAFDRAWSSVEDSKGANTAAFEAVMQDYERMSTQKQNALMEALGEGTRFDDVVDAYEAGIDPERWYDAYDEWRAIDGGEGSATDKATQFAQWLETKGGYSENESNLLQDQLAYYSMIRGSAERYDELRGFGFSPQESYNLYEAIGEMNTFKADKDENGDSISGSKKAKVIAFIDALNLTPAEKDILFNEFTTYTGLEDTPWH